MPEQQDKTMSKAIKDIEAERQRQKISEGWTPAHDDTHDGNEIALAAACYITPEHMRGDGVMTWWPWAPEWWKPGDRRRELVKAGALIAAEIDRLDRQGHNTN